MQIFKDKGCDMLHRFEQLNHGVAQLTQLSKWKDGRDPKENDPVQNWACNIHTCQNSRKS